jgi:hypothetical protein
VTSKFVSTWIYLVYYQGLPHTKEATTMSSIVYVGMDVHKESYTVLQLPH